MTKITIEVDDNDLREAFEWAGEVTLLLQEIKEEISYQSRKKMSAIDKQIGGDHYKGMAIQPIQYIQANKLSYIEGNIVKYISRWRDKNGIEDLLKIKHYVEFLIEEETKTEQQPNDLRDEKLKAYMDQTGCGGGTCEF